MDCDGDGGGSLWAGDGGRGCDDDGGMMVDSGGGDGDDDCTEADPGMLVELFKYDSERYPCGKIFNDVSGSSAPASSAAAPRSRASSSEKSLGNPANPCDIPPWLQQDIPQIPALFWGVLGALLVLGIPPVGTLGIPLVGKTIPFDP